MNINIDKKVIKINNSNNTEIKDRFIEQYKPFILNVVSNTKHAYIDTKNDDEFSIGLLAFNEAMEKYEIAKGSFLSYARLVIQSRLKTYWLKENQKNNVELDENIHFNKYNEETSKIKIEILLFEQALEYFGLSMEDLINTALKHQQTLINIKEIGRNSAKNVSVIKYVYEKKKLPITLIASNQGISKKIVRRSKNQILAIIIIIHEEFDNLLKFLF